MHNEEYKKIVKYQLSKDPQFEEMLRDAHIYGRFVTTFANIYAPRDGSHPSFSPDYIRSMFEGAKRSDIPLAQICDYSYALYTVFYKHVRIRRRDHDIKSLKDLKRY